MRHVPAFCSPVRPVGWAVRSRSLVGRLILGDVVLHRLNERIDR
jgi:hypothetical protein